MTWAGLGQLAARLLRAGAGVGLLVSGLFLVSRHQARSALLQAETTDLSAAFHPAEAAEQQNIRRAQLHRLGLDEPLFYAHYVSAVPDRPAHWRWHGRRNQYHRWLRDLASGQFGTSLRSGQPVGELLRSALAVSVPLMGAAATAATLAALLLGQWLAGHPRRTVPLHVALVGLQSIPGFALALALLLLFANPDVFDWFSVDNLAFETDAGLPNGNALATLGQFVLPVLALTLSALPGLALPLAAALRHELAAPYAVSARAKGNSMRQLVRRHALPNALLPLIAQLADLLPALVAGAAVVETVFGLPGTGRLLAHAAATHDYPVLVAGVLLVGTARLLALLLADAALLLTDPRLRWPS